MEKEGNILEKYKAIKKKLGMTDADIGKAFGYANGPAFANSARRDKVIVGIVEMWERQAALLKLDSTQ